MFKVTYTWITEYRTEATVTRRFATEAQAQAWLDGISGLLCFVRGEISAA